MDSIKGLAMVNETSRAVRSRAVRSRRLTQQRAMRVSFTVSVSLGSTTLASAAAFGDFVASSLSSSDFSTLLSTNLGVAISVQV